MWQTGVGKPSHMWRSSISVPGVYNNRLCNFRVTNHRLADWRVNVVRQPSLGNHSSQCRLKYSQIGFSSPNPKYSPTSLIVITSLSVNDGLKPRFLNPLQPNFCFIKSSAKQNTCMIKSSIGHRLLLHFNGFLFNTVIAEGDAYLKNS